MVVDTVTSVEHTWSSGTVEGWLKIDAADALQVLSGELRSNGSGVLGTYKLVSLEHADYIIAKATMRRSAAGGTCYGRLRLVDTTTNTVVWKDSVVVGTTNVNYSSSIGIIPAGVYRFEFERRGTTATSFYIDNVLLAYADTSTVVDCDGKGDYRYGFNGQEKDDEVKGESNSYDVGARLYDNRLGRFLTLDPYIKKYPSISPYIFGYNNPIWFVDAFGMGGDDPNLPVSGGIITSKFKAQRTCDGCSKVHGGTDISVPVGTEIKPLAGGKVAYSGQMNGYGNVVILDHGKNADGKTVYTLYAHLSDIKVQENEKVSSGQLIGLTGGEVGAPGSGSSKGPHLHYEVIATDKYKPSNAGFFTDPITGKGYNLEIRYTPEQFLPLLNKSLLEIEYEKNIAFADQMLKTLNAMNTDNLYTKEIQQMTSYRSDQVKELEKVQKGIFDPDDGGQSTEQGEPLDDNLNAPTSTPTPTNNQNNGNE